MARIPMGHQQEVPMDVVKPFVKNPQTDADVNAVLAMLADLAPDGRIVGHEQCEAVLRVPRDTVRYKLIMGHVRRRLEEERGIVLDGRGLKGKGWLALTRAEQVSRGHVGVRQKFRLAKRDVRRMALPLNEELPESMRSFRAGFVASMSRVFAAADQAQKDARMLPGVVRSLPFGKPETAGR